MQTSEEVYHTTWYVIGLCTCFFKKFMTMPWLKTSIINYSVLESVKYSFSFAFLRLF